MDLNVVLQSVTEIIMNPQKLTTFLMLTIPVMMQFLFKIFIACMMAISVIVGPLAIISYGLKKNEQTLGMPFFAMVGLYFATETFPLIMQSLWTAMNEAMRNVVPHHEFNKLDFTIIQVGSFNLHNVYLSLGICFGFLVFAFVLSRGKDRQKEDDRIVKSKVTKEALMNYFSQGISYSVRMNQPLFMAGILGMTLYSIAVASSVLFPI